MTENKTKPTATSVKEFLSNISIERQQEATQLIVLSQELSGEKPVMWGPSIIGFGSKHYVYDTGREGDIPIFSFSPRKSTLTIYFSEGFDRYSKELSLLGPHKLGASCLYITRLKDIKIHVLRKMIQKSLMLHYSDIKKPQTVEDYINLIPQASKAHFNQLRVLVRTVLPEAEEVLSYGIVGYKTDTHRAKVFISGWKDHVSVYPVPKSEFLQKQLTPYIKGKGTLWFSLDDSLPTVLITQAVKELAGVS